MSAVGGNVYARISTGTGFLSDTWTVPGTWGYSDFTWVGDFNGDDKTDIASAIGNNVYMSLSTGASFTSATWTVPGPRGYSGYTWVGDFNGDGKTDIASAIGNNVYMNLSTGTSFDSATWTVPGPRGSSGYTWVDDFNGDGKTDIASAIGNNVYMNLSTGTSFDSATWTVPGPRGSSDYTWVSDFNGDGKADIASAIGTSVYMNLSTGTSFNSATWTVPGTWGYSDFTWVGDFNGDRKADIASAIGNNVYMNLSTGTSFDSATWTVPGPRGGSGYTWAKDFNGDGKTDIASAIGSATYMNLSTGSSFTSSTWGSSALADSTFSMVFMSDPQFNWSCQDEGNTTNDYCRVAANRAKDEETQALETNMNHASAIRAIHTSMGSSFKGVVINGDLTAFGNKDGELSRFGDVYLSLGVPVWPGLGNHDYQNNVNDCGAKAWANWNYCAADMAQFLANYARSSDQISNNDVTKYDENFAQAQDQRNVSGSLAYSWDIGKFHFVQLNNYPTYTESFTRGYNSGISSWDIDITSPAAWLNADLAAAGADRKIILNWHKYGDVYSDSTARAGLIAMLAPYAGSIEAIFVGHFHGWFGPRETLSFPAVTTAVPATATTPAIPVRAAINVPVIYSGSAIYNRFIRADFDTRTGCTITISVIATSSGSPVAAGSTPIDCR